MRLLEIKSPWTGQRERVLSASPVKAEYEKFGGKQCWLGDTEVKVTHWERESQSGSWSAGFKWMHTTYGVLTKQDKKTGRREVSLNHGKTWHQSLKEAGRSSGKVILRREGTKEFAYDDIQRINRNY